MKKVTELYSYLDSRIPKELSEEWDNDGLMIGCYDKAAAKVLIVLDVTESAVEYAVENGFDVIVSHHPLIFSPLKAVTDEKILTLIRSGIAVFSFHTRLDNNSPGVNDALARVLELENVRELGMIRIGRLKKAMSPEEFASFVKSKLGADSVTAVINGDTVSETALLGGSGKDMIALAADSGADTFLTGEISYNAMSDALEQTGLNIFTAGHFETEFPVCFLLEEMINEFDKDIYTEVGRFNNLTVMK